MPYHKTPSPDSNEIHNILADLGHYCFILNLSDPCASVNKKRRRNIAYPLYDHAQAQESLPWGS